MRKLILFAVFWQVLNCSAYCHTGSPTASGVWPRVGICAADHLPFGSRVTLPDGRVLVVEDRFGGGYKDRLDIFMNTEQECWNFGRRWLRCRIEIQ
ncbi:MAG: 3D domain-containing protein [Acidaminococcaceae bacterium]|nr:3D domain-containing protein [Acidaminococcaceae bacterium]